MSIAWYVRDYVESFCRWNGEGGQGDKAVFFYDNIEDLEKRREEQEGVHEIDSGEQERRYHRQTLVDHFQEQGGSKNPEQVLGFEQKSLVQRQRVPLIEY